MSAPERHTTGAWHDDLPAGSLLLVPIATVLAVPAAVGAILLLAGLLLVLVASVLDGVNLISHQ